MSCFWAVVAVCVLGIVIGSFADYRINEALANKTALGSFFATYGSYFSYCLYPAAEADAEAKPDRSAADTKARRK